MTNKTIYLAGGCFWGTQKFFDQFEGVVSTEVGYANGPDGVNEPDGVNGPDGSKEPDGVNGPDGANGPGSMNSPAAAPSYQDVCNNSGHAETVLIDYDESVLSLTDLLNYYFLVIDPLSVNKQGGDTGIQYRTGIYYTSEDQLPEIEAVYREQEEKAGAKLAVELEPLRNFYSAEEYHQKYLDKNPGGYCHIPARYFHLQSK